MTKRPEQCETAERHVKDIRRKTRKRYSSEEKIRIVLARLRGEDSVSELCRQEGISKGPSNSWSKEFIEAAKRRMAENSAPQETPTLENYMS